MQLQSRPARPQRGGPVVFASLTGQYFMLHECNPNGHYWIFFLPRWDFFFSPVHQSHILCVHNYQTEGDELKRKVWRWSHGRTDGEVRIGEDVILTLSEEFWFRVGENAWLGVYAFVTLGLRKRTGDLDYAQKTMHLYAVRLWLPEYVDAGKTSVVLNVFDGKFHPYVFCHPATFLS
jgi:hypothetical protein